VRYTPAGGQIDVELFWDQSPREEPRLDRDETEPAAGDLRPADRQQVVLRVSDTGIGIAEADRERIFERFYRVQKDRSQDTGGTGLGLAIVKQLVQVLEGSITVSSRKGQGTCFEIRLPGVGFTQSSSKPSGQSAQIR
jgi:signal transduction histidine kinase